MQNLSSCCGKSPSLKPLPTAPTKFLRSQDTHTLSDHHAGAEGFRTLSIVVVQIWATNLEKYLAVYYKVKHMLKI